MRAEPPGPPDTNARPAQTRGERATISSSALNKSDPKLTPKPISDELWSAVEPLLPAPTRAEGHTFQRRPGGGRKPIPARQAFEAILHVLRTGTPWKELPTTIGSPSAIHRRFDQWHAAGLFLRLWQAGLAEHAELEGIPWVWSLQDTSETTGTISTEMVHTPVSSSLIQPRSWHPSFVRRRQRRSGGHSRPPFISG